MIYVYLLAPNHLVSSQPKNYFNFYLVLLVLVLPALKHYPVSDLTSKEA